jgi:hypothetical protein
LRCRQAARQLEQRERVAARLGDDSLAYRVVHRPGNDGRQERLRIVTVEAANGEIAQPAEPVLLAGLTCGEEKPDGLGHQPTRGEGERLDRRPVDPLRVVDEAEERPFVRHRRQERQGGEANEEAVRRAPATQAKSGLDGRALRVRQPVKAVEHLRTELVEAPEGQVHLPFDT